MTKHAPTASNETCVSGTNFAVQFANKFAGKNERHPTMPCTSLVITSDCQRLALEKMRFFQPPWHSTWWNETTWNQRAGNLQKSAAKTKKHCRAESTHCASGWPKWHKFQP
jgi:hypothetical protein